MKLLHNPDGINMSEDQHYQWVLASLASWPVGAADVENPSVPFLAGPEVGASDRTSIYGRKFHKVRFRRKTFSLNYQNTEQATRDYLASIFESTDGFRVPFIIGDLPGAFGPFVVSGSESVFPLTQTGFDAWSGSFPLNEVIW